MGSSGITFLKESGLIRKAAAARNLVLPEKSREHAFHPEYDSEIVGTFKLSKEFLATLKKYGVTFEPGDDELRKDMIYLCGHSHQPNAEIWESDCWAWKQGKVRYELTVNFRVSADESKRGVVCLPHIWGNCSGGACHQPTINKVVAAIAEHFPDAHRLIKEAPDSDFKPVIPWSEIGVGGVKSIWKLFYELFAENKRVKDLARSHLSPFDPNPHQQKNWGEPKDELFVPEMDQTKLFRQWKEQLEKFKESF